jgi:pimeloyl-ACP methyl ester carboxylesterase
MPALSKRPDTIVLVHGFWVTPRSWEHWIPRYEARGYRVLAPAYPGFEVEVEALNRDPSPVERLTVPAIMAHMKGVVERVEAPPILVGHSAGGAFVQLLLDRGYGAVGVAINSAPTEGVRVTPLSQLKSTFPVLKNPANRHRAVAFTYDQWRYVFTNTFDEADARAAYDRYHVPASGGIFWDSVLANFIPGPQDIAVDYHNAARAPLLFISGSKDHLIRPPSNARTRSTTSRTRSRRSRNFRDARISCPPSRGGRRSPTMHWRGPRSTVRTSRRPLRHLHEMRPPNVRLTRARSVGGAKPFS